MTLPVVQFCFAIANGDADRVRKLLPEISEEGLFQELNSGISPAVFCLWASQQSPEQILNKLNELYPEESRIKQYSKPNQESALDIAIPMIKSKLYTLFNTMVTHMDMPPDLMGDPNKQFTLNACTAALRFILEDVELTEDKRTIAQSMLEKFSKIRPTLRQLDNVRPKVLDVLLAEQKNYLPSASLKRSPSAKELEKRLDLHSENLRENHRFKCPPVA